jgi:hypothetical protein
MFFNIDSDTGKVINGWIAPDNPSSIPKIIVSTHGRPEIVLEADVPRADVRDLGLHTTGQVGFRLTDDIVPGMSSAADIEILDADTRILLYRRFQPDRHIERKMFLFDCAAMPQRRLMQNVSDFFSLNYANSERFSLETIIVLLNNHFSKSLFFCGRPSFNRVGSFLENGGYFRAALVRDPIEELAERLLFLNLLSRENAAQFRSIYSTGLTSLIGFAKDLDFADHKSLLSAFRQIDLEQRQALVSPMVRMFACTLDEQPTYNHISLSLEHLSSLDLVGSRARFTAFQTMLEQFLGVDAFGGESPLTSPSVAPLAESLSRIGIVLDLLEHDIALYEYVEDSLATGLKGGAELVARDTQTI